MCNFVPVERKSYCFGVPYKGKYKEVFNSSTDDGSPATNGTVKSVEQGMHGFEQSVCIDIPAFSVMYFTVEKEKDKKTRAAGKKTAKKPAAKTTAAKAKTEAETKAVKAEDKKPAEKKTAAKKPAAKKTAEKKTTKTAKKG